MVNNAEFMFPLIQYILDQESKSRSEYIKRMLNSKRQRLQVLGGHPGGPDLSLEEIKEIKDIEGDIKLGQDASKR